MNEIVQKIVRPSALQLGMILGLLLALLFIFLDPGAKADSEINTTAESAAIEGYDTVAYFTKKRRCRGQKNSPIAGKMRFGSLPVLNTATCSPIILRSFPRNMAVTELGGSPTGMPMALTRRLMSS